MARRETFIVLLRDRRARRVVGATLVAALVAALAVTGVILAVADDGRPELRVASGPAEADGDGSALVNPNAARILVPTYLPDGFQLRRNDVEHVPSPGGPSVHHLAHYDDGSAVAPDGARPGEAARTAHAEVLVNVITGPTRQDEFDRMAQEPGVRRIQLRGRTAVVMGGGGGADAASDLAEAARVPLVPKQIALKWVEADGVSVFVSAKNVAKGEVLRIAEGLVRE